MPAEAPPAPAPPPAAAAPATPSAPAPDMISPLPSPSDPPKPGSARDRMRKETSSRWEQDDPIAKAESKAAKPVERPGVETKPEPAKAKPAEEPAAATEVPPEVTPEQKKKNPWVLMRQEKERADRLERQLAERKEASIAETEKASYLERIEKAEKRAKEKEDEIRFKNYEKSDEFKEKYEVPYEKAWQKHMKDLKEVVLTGDDGVPRPVKDSDMLDLVNLSLPDARKLANEKWGDFANEAMLARKEIRDTFEAKLTALDEARKTGADREKQFQENAAKWRADVQNHIKLTWEEANQQALNDAKNAEFFKPVEGDDKHNELLTKGFNQVDEAFGKNPWDPKLTPEERAKVVKQHAAVRNRSAAFGGMKYIIAKLRQRLAEVEKENAGFKGSQPETAGGGGSPSAGRPATGAARDRMHNAGDKWAK